uniref:Uncharacterized protein n=1 Tax=Quercus lobata TaxID=97700 RepID=A0A7N2MH53_QUELO
MSCIVLHMISVSLTRRGVDRPTEPNLLEGFDRTRIGLNPIWLEMTRIQLFSSHGNPSAKIISRLKAGGEKTIQALKSLCWRCKGIQVEEAALTGVDSLGFDVKVCSGTQVQTLRFAFNTQAPSEYSAERQLNDLLFPRIHHKPQMMKQTPK